MTATRPAAPGIHLGGPTAEPISARLVEVSGLVQAVGYRAFVWRQATRRGLAGWVRHRDRAVEILAEGPEASLDEFCAALVDDAPPLAAVRGVRSSARDPIHVAGFLVLKGTGRVDGPEEGAPGVRLVAPDIATCPACLHELFDPQNRRYRYPFIDCPDCGPRFGIIEAVPWEREHTSMRDFVMCADCAREYDDPTDRRFRAESVSCPACGPQLTLRVSSWGPHPGDPITEAAAMLRQGAIVAVKGPGGYQLACDATNETAVAELRRRKDSPDEPFTVVVPTLEEAEALLQVSAEEGEALSGWRAPVVLVRHHGKLATGLAPAQGRQGLALPPTPLHHLLARETNLPLVMASGNASGDRICISDEEARDRLSGIADAFLVHDRRVATGYDDSVIRVRGDSPMLLRRGRGFVPEPVHLPIEAPPILATGVDVGSAFCLASGDLAVLSEELADPESPSAMRAYTDTLDRYRALVGIEPEAIVHDLDPDLATTRFAATFGLPTVGVQHHHAHIASVMAEHGIVDRVIGVAFDRAGLGEDGTVWGGEFLVCDAATSERAGHLRAVRRPGDGAAARNPARMALAHAVDAGVLKQALRLLGTDASHSKAVLTQIESGGNSPLTTSAGGLFDAIAALAGVSRHCSDHGQATTMLEQAADQSATFEYPFELDVEGGRVVLDTRPVVVAAVKDLVKGRSAGEVAGRFHRTMSAATLSVCRLLRGRTGLERVCLGGELFRNDLLASDLAARLTACDFQVFLPRQVPPGDSGIALGQALVGARLGTSDVPREAAPNPRRRRRA